MEIVKNILFAVEKVLMNLVLPFLISKLNPFLVRTLNRTVKYDLWTSQFRFHGAVRISTETRDLNIFDFYCDRFSMKY